MNLIIDAFTITGIISASCVVLVLLALNDCCKIRYTLRKKMGND